MTKAIAQNGIVTDIARVDPFTIFQPAYAAQFIDAPDDVAPGWLYDGTTFTAPPVPEKTPEQLREAAKAARAAAVEAITVTTAAGNTFDGDETSQARMSRAILVLSTGAAASVPWVLANNIVIQATAAELTEALALAGAEQAQLWVLP